jgi:hypothetical protein
VTGNIFFILHGTISDKNLLRDRLNIQERK